jgi:hypothetical protein
MTDIMTVGSREQRLPAPLQVGRTFIPDLEQRVHDLELVCKAQQTALNFVLVRWMKASDQKDLKAKVWPVMNAADMVLGDD